MGAIGLLYRICTGTQGSGSVIDTFSIEVNDIYAYLSCYTAGHSPSSGTVVRLHVELEPSTNTEISVSSTTDSATYSPTETVNSLSDAYTASATSSDISSTTTDSATFSYTESVSTSSDTYSASATSSNISTSASASPAPKRLVYARNLGGTSAYTLPKVATSTDGGGNLGFVY